MSGDSRMDQMLDLARAALDASSEAEWWESVATAVSGPLFAAVVMAVTVVNPEDMFGWFIAVYPRAARAKIPVNSPMDEVLSRQHPFTLRLRAGPVTEPMKVTDLVSPREWRNLAAYERMRELTGGAHHMVLHVPRAAPYAESVSIVRRDRDFDEAEMARAAQLQTVVKLSVSHLRHVADRERRWGPLFEQDAARAADALGLTARQRVVLDMIGVGASTDEISRRLRISRSTVYKHEQNLYRKLGATDHLNAVLRGRRLGLLPGDAAAHPAAPSVSPPLTRREAAVLALLATGMTNGTIADTLFLSPKTVGVHVGNVLRKLDAHTRTEAVSLAYRAGLLH